MKNWYYILFVAGLYLFNQTFQEFVLVNGIISGLIAGLIIAFLCKLLFSVITKTVIFLAIIGAIAAFLFSTGNLTIPIFGSNFLEFHSVFPGINNIFL